MLKNRKNRKNLKKHLTIDKILPYIWGNKKLKNMETQLTYLVNNLTIIVTCSIFAAAIIYQAIAELKKVLTNKK